MATGKAEGKSGFLKEFLVDSPAAAKEAIDAAWQEAGHEGTISTSLISKVRRDQEQESKGAAKGKSRPRGNGGAAGTGREGRRYRRRGRPRGRRPIAGEGEPGPCHGEFGRGRAVGQRPRGRAHAAGGALDDMLHEIKLAGGLPEFEETLRRARRILRAQLRGVSAAVGRGTNPVAPEHCLECDDLGKARPAARMLSGGLGYAKGEAPGCVLGKVEETRPLPPAWAAKGNATTPKRLVPASAR